MLLLKRIGIAALLVLLALQFIPVHRDNPAVDRSITIYATTSVPPRVHAILDRACNDCHSNETRWPWYGYVAPVSWVVANDVHEARRKMNLSEWGRYSQNKQDHELEEICNQVLSGDMPDGKYSFVHRHSRLIPEDHEAICQWTGSSPQQVPGK